MLHMDIARHRNSFTKHRKSQFYNLSPLSNKGKVIYNKGATEGKKIPYVEDSLLVHVDISIIMLKLFEYNGSSN